MVKLISPLIIGFFFSLCYIEGKGCLFLGLRNAKNTYNSYMPDIGKWSINRLLSTAARMLEHSWNAQLKDLGLTHAGVTALGVISQNGEISQVKVAQIVGVQAQTMGKTLARLESHGHIARIRSSADRRSYLLTITDAGEDALMRAQQVDKTLSELGQLANPQFHEMLIDVIHELSTHEGGKEIFHSAVEGNMVPSPEKVNTVEVDEEIDQSRPLTAVIEVLSPEDAREN